MIGTEAPAPDAPRRVGEFLGAKLRDLDGALQDASQRVLQGGRGFRRGPDAPRIGTDPAVHDLRVVLRRMRTLLEVSADVFGRFRVDEVRRALRHVHRATGAVRDEEVLIALVESLGLADANTATWLEARRRRERRLRTALRRIVRAGEIDRARALLSALLAFRVNPAKDKRLTKFARRAVDSAKTATERIEQPAIDDAEALHRLRIAYKRLRYTAEAFVEALPDDLATLAPLAARLQRRLGDLRDVDVAVDVVLKARALADRAPVLAALGQVRAARAEAYAKAVSGAQAEGADSLRKISTR
jgi:CHAD domain-containing protein